MRSIELRVGGKRIPLNTFAREVVTNTLLGLLKSLRDVSLEEEISITLAKDSS